MESIGILCERVRVEEKNILAVLQNEGLPAVPVPPLDLPVAIGADPLLHTGSTVAGQYPVLIDRCPERSAGSHAVSLLTERGVDVLGAGLAATGNRLVVARTLADAGLARPWSVFVGSEKAGLTALRDLGYPSTLMPMALNKRPIPIFDQDIAEAILEHRNTLGSASSRLMVIQQDTPGTTEVLDVVVVDGNAIASSVAGKSVLRQESALRLAAQAAVALDAQIIGVRIAQVSAGVVVWDVDPVPEFRHYNQIGPLSVAEAIARLVAKRHPELSTGAAGMGNTRGHDRSALIEESTRGVVLTA